MDIGFVPGGTSFDNDARRYLSQRPSSVVIQPAAGTIESFISELKTSTTVQRPVGNLGIGCHGHPQGVLEIRLDSGSGKHAYFDDVDKAVTSGTITISTSVLEPRPVVDGSPVAAKFRIVGCSIGAAVPYLVRLKAALGGKVKVVATPHEDLMVGTLTINGVAVVIRMLEYDFRIFTPMGLSFEGEAIGQAGVIDLFAAKYPSWFDGVPIPKEFWKKMVPADVFANVDDDPKTGKIVTGVGLEFNPAINGVKNFGIEFSANIWQHKLEKVGPYTVTPPSQNLASSTQRREFIRGKIKNRPEFAAGHLFPLHKQLGYNSYDEFIDGHDWIAPGSAPDQWRGYRDLYRVQTPITSPGGSNKPLYDVVSNSSSVGRIGLDETDARLFITV
jgi:hypothetical protein